MKLSAPLTGLILVKPTANYQQMVERLHQMADGHHKMAEKLQLMVERHQMLKKLCLEKIQPQVIERLLFQ